MNGIQNTSTNNFNTIIGNNKKFQVPKFQRDYSWTNEQWDDLWQDIETMVAENEDHYMGYLVLQTSNDKEFLIIDGQQRFTTVTILILASIKCIKKLIERGQDVDDNQRRMDSLLLSYIGKADPVTLEYDNVLILNRNNEGYFRDYIVKLGELRVRNLKLSEKLMKQCFDFFEQRLCNKFTTGREYAQYVQTVVDHLYFTQIVVNDEMNAFRVFETLNARGVQLSSADLLKNYLFSLVDKAYQHRSYVEILEEKWSKLVNNIKIEKLPEFLRYYWNCNHKSIRANALFKTLRKEIVNEKQVFELVDDLMRYSDVYMALMSKEDVLWDSIEQKNAVALLKLFRFKQPYSLLMAAKLNLSTAEFTKLFKYVLTLCFRYNVICDKNPNDQEAPFNALAMYITKEKKADYSLLAPIKIDNKTFETAFATKSFVYNSRSTKIIRYILGQIEKHDGLGRTVSFDDEEASIEHIMPQNADESWNIDEEIQRQFVFRLGNTCLLERSLNKKIQNASYEEKLQVYQDSKFWDAQHLSQEYPEWNEDSISKRQNKMARKVANIWKL